MFNLKSCHILKSQGILRLHAVSLQRAGSKTVVRLGLAEWNQEVEICCFLAWVTLDGQFSRFSFSSCNQADSMVQNQSWLLEKKVSRQDSRNGYGCHRRWRCIVWWSSNGIRPETVHWRDPWLNIRSHFIKLMEQKIRIQKKTSSCLLKAIFKCWQLRDFHTEAKEVLVLKDPTYHPSLMSCWKESLPEETSTTAGVTWWICPILTQICMLGKAFFIQFTFATSHLNSVDIIDGCYPQWGCGNWRCWSKAWRPLFWCQSPCCTKISQSVSM